ncbi:uncharacterized protein LOC127794002 [Diospyros lotus]|uniref:uncharacterized protein LOC127794002 n=1 Tax=Diospyros lotus TaxID=55363 RepID=UPI00224E1643|nr:uncharacterized protein LOC127794002 [Diospyros lotus]
MAFPSTLVATITLILLASAAQGLVINGQTISNAIIGGTLVCEDTSLAVAKTFQPIPQALVELRCGNTSTSTETVLMSVLTDAAGTYFLGFSVLDTLLFDPAQCYLRATIPPGSSCALFIPNGFLRIPLVVLDVVQALLGFWAVFIAGPVTYMVQ